MNSSERAQREIPAADWSPTPEFFSTTNVAWLMKNAGAQSYDELHAWSVTNRAAYWKCTIERLGIQFRKQADDIIDLSAGVEVPCWLPGARLNIVESCFRAAPEIPAILDQAEGGSLKKMTYGELQALAGRVAANLRKCGFGPGSAIAIFMPMNARAVAIYLGIVRAGCVVVGIADSFQPKEITTRLRLANTVAMFTQDVVVRAGKELPLYARAREAAGPMTIVLPARAEVSVALRAGDRAWREFLQDAPSFETERRNPDDPLNILFSSGTTGEPKAIPWTQTTPIKCAADAHFHQNIQPGDVLAWPTNLGWMMGPWLIFASLLNRATMALYEGAPTGGAFGKFIDDTQVTMLGVVPSLVNTWRTSGCMNGCDWSSIKVFSSTGECSSADDMRWLMSRANGAPVIEYCGGTEIGGGYITETLAKPIVAGAFNTPALGLDFVICDEQGNPADTGELFLSPPSIGLSATLLNKDHHAVYFSETPSGPHGEPLRRHGDQVTVLPGGYWRALGRADDTMNLGGIKVSSAEIEQVLVTIPEVREAAAIAVSLNGGPSKLVIYAVCAHDRRLSHDQLLEAMQTAIKRDLNPLFKIHELLIIGALPRTASNKVMRRELRAQYLSQSVQR